MSGTVVAILSIKRVLQRLCVTFQAGVTSVRTPSKGPAVEPDLGRVQLLQF
jgi:hypothetical protein